MESHRGRSQNWRPQKQPACRTQGLFEPHSPQRSSEEVGQFAVSDGCRSGTGVCGETPPMGPSRTAPSVVPAIDVFNDYCTRCFHTDLLRNRALLPQNWVTPDCMYISPQCYRQASHRPSRAGGRRRLPHRHRRGSGFSCLLVVSQPACSEGIHGGSGHPA